MTGACSAKSRTPAGLCHQDVNLWAARFLTATGALSSEGDASLSAGPRGSDLSLRMILEPPLTPGFAPPVAGLRIVGREPGGSKEWRDQASSSSSLCSRWSPAAVSSRRDSPPQRNTQARRWVPLIALPHGQAHPPLRPHRRPCCRHRLVLPARLPPPIRQTQRRRQPALRAPRFRASRLASRTRLRQPL